MKKPSIVILPEYALNQPRAIPEGTIGWINVRDPGRGSEVKICEKLDQCQNRLRVEFFDTETGDNELCRQYPHISQEQADQITEFVIDLWTEIDFFLVNCEAGVSRSPAIGLAIASHLSLDWMSGYFAPNRTVFWKVMQSFGAKPEDIQRHWHNKTGLLQKKREDAA